MMIRCLILWRLWLYWERLHNSDAAESLPFSLPSPWQNRTKISHFIHHLFQRQFHPSHFRSLANKKQLNKSTLQPEKQKS